MSAKVSQVVTHLREQYDAPLVMSAKNGGLYDVAVVLGAELQSLLSDVTELEALTYLDGMTKGFELAGPRAQERKVFTTILGPEDPREVTADFVIREDTAVVVETYLVSTGEPVYGIVAKEGRTNSGHPLVALADCDETVMIRVIGL